MPELVITAVGRDRPGLVGELSGQLFAAGANLADSRMVNLRGQFALLVLVEGSDDALARVREMLPKSAQKLGLDVGFAGEPGAAPHRGLPFRLKTYSVDQPGIVHRVTDLLHRRGINVEELVTRVESSPFSGDPLFTMSLSMSVPSSVNVRELRREIDELCNQLNCDADLEPGG